MRPAARVWRKSARAALRGARRGRRATHRTYIQAPRRGSTWLRRHPGALDYWMRHAGTTRLPADLKTPPESDTKDGS